MHSENIKKIEELTEKLEIVLASDTFPFESKKPLQDTIDGIKNELKKDSINDDVIIIYVSSLTSIMGNVIFADPALLALFAKSESCLDQYARWSLECGTDLVCLGIAFAWLMTCLLGETFTTSNSPPATTPPTTSTTPGIIPDYSADCLHQTTVVTINPTNTSMRVRVRNLGECFIELLLRPYPVRSSHSLITNHRMENGDPPIVLGIPTNSQFEIRCGDCSSSKCEYKIDYI